MSGNAFEPEAQAQSGVMGRLRRIGVSLLPLGLFLGVTLGYDRLASRKHGATLAAKAGSPVAGPATFNDKRSLDELSRRIAAVPPVPGPTQTRGASAARAHSTEPRMLDLELGSGVTVPLGLALPERLQPGAYAEVRGMPANAALSHGIAVSGGRWLVDGSEIGVVGLSMRSGTAGLLPLDIALRAQSGTILASERIEIAVREPLPPLEPMHIVPPTPIELPITAPAIDLDRTFGAEIAVEQAAPESLLAAGGAFKITVTGAGQGGDAPRLMLTGEVSAALVDAAFVVLDGVPPQAVLSRGFSIGARTWMVTLADLTGVEIRLADPTPPALEVEAALFTASGKRLASDRVRHEPTPVVAGTMVGGADLIRPSARDIAAAQEVAAQSVTRTAPPSPSASYRIAAAPTAPSRTPTLVVPAWQGLLDRGRRMLELGNIAVARPLLERATRDGSAEAAALLGASYDDAWLKRQGALSLAADQGKAQQWYEAARRLGAPDVERIVAALRVR